MTSFSAIYDDIGNNRLYNLHSHTQYCDGRATMDEFAAAAIAAGFSHYGFSPHSPICVASSCNMQASLVGEYLKNVERIKEQFPSATKFYSSMEIDYLNNEWGPATDYFQKLPLDYRIGSIHFIPSQEGDYIDIDGRPERFKDKLHNFFRGDLRYVVESFFSQSIKMIEEGGFDIIGHFDKISYNASTIDPDIETSEWYQGLLNNLVESIIDSGVAVEINTKAFATTGRFFPSPILWKRLINAGTRIVVNSDAHYLELINASRSEAFAILDSTK